MLLETQAIVLAGQKLGEADTLVTLLTFDHGLLKGVAKGARRMKSRFGSALQPFSYGQAILFGMRPTVLRRVNHVDSIHSFRGLREDFDRMMLAATMANATRTLLPEEQPSRETFALLLRAFRALEGGEDGARVVLFFLLALLRVAGYQPRVDRCLVGRHPFSDSMRARATRWFFVPQLGGTVCASCHADLASSVGPMERPPAVPLSSGAHAFLRQAVRMPSSLRDRLKVDGALLQEAQSLIEACLAARARRVIKRPIPFTPRDAAPAGIGPRHG
ncbi:MAG: DNA repair protein RecO [Nitrospirae bacterium]|nr:DNA repair protein RecO [Nitrospirota bacterium]